jgi:tripartite-type tricarboxylate transporter receptor subunit TctC
MPSRPYEVRRVVARSIAGSLALLATTLHAFVCSADAQAQNFPTRPVNVIVQLAAGTGMDTVVRLYAQQLSANFGQPVIVENRPGSAGLATMEAILKAPADGYTLGAATSSALAIRPSLFKKLPYDVLADFVPIALYLKSPFVLVVNPGLPINSVPDLIRFIRERPGQVSFSSPGIGGAPHLAGEYLKQRFALDIAHVPYRNSPQAISDVVAGHVALTFAEAGVSLPLIAEGKLRALAVTSARPLDALPGIPPLAQAVGAPDFEAVSWHALIARASTPPEVVNKLHDEMKVVFAKPEIAAAVARLGLLPETPKPIEPTQDYIRSELIKWGALVKSLGLEGSQ